MAEIVEMINDAGPTGRGLHASPAPAPTRLRPLRAREPLENQPRRLSLRLRPPLRRWSPLLPQPQHL